MIDRPRPGDRPWHAADGAPKLRGRTARLATGVVQAAAIRRRIRIPLRFADDYSTTATVVSFTGLTDAQQHVALELGRPAAAELPLVRLHSECLTGDVFGSQRCDCGPQLREAVERITRHGGYVLYLRQEGRGIGLYDNSTPTRCKIAAWIRTTRISRSATNPTSATTPAQPRCCTRSAPTVSRCLATTRTRELNWPA